MSDDKKPQPKPQQIPKKPKPKIVTEKKSLDSPKKPQEQPKPATKEGK